MFILQRIDDGQYVALPGQSKSYTKKLEQARLFPTRQSAEAEKCGNERVIAAEWWKK